MVPAILLSLRETRWLPLLFMLAGGAWTTIYAQSLLQQEMPPGLQKKTLVVTGRVVGLPRHRENSTRFEFRIEQARYRDRPIKLPDLVRLSSYSYRDQPAFSPPPGSRWQLHVRLKSPHGFHNPGGLDYEAYLFSQGIRATGYVYGRYVPVRLDAEPGFLDLHRTRASISRRIKRILDGDPQAGIISALAVGDRQDIDIAGWELLRRTGTSHLVAISGLHLSLVSGLVFILVRYCWGAWTFGCKRLPAQKAAAMVALLVAVIYAALAGFSVPTQRALIMLAVVYFALMRSRQGFRIRVLAIALLLVLTFDPLAVLGPGFWLSFTAVTIIIYFAAVSPVSRSWLDGVRVQLAISLGLVPVTLLFFQGASLVSPVANLLAIPVYALAVVPLTLVGLVLPDGMAQAVLQLAAAISMLGWQGIQAVDQFLPSYVEHASPGAWQTLLALAGLAYAANGMWPGRWLGLVLCLPLVSSPSVPEYGRYRLTLLDVGQGLSLVVQTRGHVLVYDTGPRLSGSFNAGDAVVVPYLRQQGIRKIDTLVISHGDTDHIGGLDSVLNRFAVNKLLSNARAAHPTGPCTAPRDWTWDGVRFEILHPATGSPARDNDSSCVLRVSSGQGSVLAAGDIEKSAERQLVEKYGDRLESTYLVAPHHGSQTSSSDRFLEAVKPTWILVPAGHLNRYRHPHPEVIKRYQRLGFHWMITGREGALTIDPSDQDGKPASYRDQYRRYWHYRRDRHKSE